MTAKDFIVAIELGSSKVTGIAGKKNSDGSIQIFAYAREEASSFIRKGVVCNIDKMALSLTSIINKLEAELEASIAKVYVGIGGQSLRSKKNFIVRQLEEETKIQKELIDSIMESNRHTPYAELEILEVIPQEYKVKNSYITDPIGMVSNQIEGHFLNIVARSSIKQNIISSFEQANIEIAGFLISPMSMADAVLTDVEKRSGCVLVDFGADTTTVSVYKNDILRHLAVLPLGGNNLTKDISSLQIEEPDAEILKIKYGCAYTDTEDKELENKTYSIDEKRTISAKTLNDIVEARTEEIIANVINQIDLSGCRDKLTAGVVLTGGGANLKKLTEAFTIRHKANKVRIANFVQWEIKATRPELLIKNGMLNTLFGLLADGKENCCEVEAPKVPENLFDTITEEADEQAEALRQLEKERIEKEKEAELIAKDDDFWKTCQDDEDWEKYLKQYPAGRHAREAEEAIRIAEQEQQKKEDDDFWEMCQSNKQWKRYLKAYPEGLHADEAEKMLEKQKEEKKENSFFGRFGKNFKDTVSKVSKNILDEE